MVRHVAPVQAFAQARLDLDRQREAFGNCVCGFLGALQGTGIQRGDGQRGEMFCDGARLRVSQFRQAMVARSADFVAVPHEIQSGQFRILPIRSNARVP